MVLSPSNLKKGSFAKKPNTENQFSNVADFTPKNLIVRTVVVT